jgi:AcrR family transcriptional regulator
MTDALLTPVKRARRARILTAAEAVFRAQGFRGATMEGIAEAAGMSKATLYGYFPDKEAAFRAVAADFAGRLETRFRAALAQPGPVTARVAAALAEKHAMVTETVLSSSQARDIFDARERMAADLFGALDIRLIDALAGELAPLKGAQAARIARLLFHAARGLAGVSPAPAAVAEDIALLARAVLADGVTPA